jgi:hypothetical protein
MTTEFGRKDNQPSGSSSYISLSKNLEVGGVRVKENFSGVKIFSKLSLQICENHVRSQTFSSKLPFSKKN